MHSLPSALKPINVDENGRAEKHTIATGNVGCSAFSDSRWSAFGDVAREFGCCARRKGLQRFQDVTERQEKQKHMSQCQPPKPSALKEPAEAKSEQKVVGLYMKYVLLLLSGKARGILSVCGDW